MTEQLDNVETTKKARTPMIIRDVLLTGSNGQKYVLHYRALGKERDHFSGFITKRLGWRKNCAISIPVVHGKEEFQKVVHTILDNSDKFNERNTVGRPRYYDILSEGVENIKETNLVQDLKTNNPDFHFLRNSKRGWYYRNISGNFNMNSIKILNIRYQETVPFDKLLEFIPNEEIHELVKELSRKTFQYEKEFIEFANQFIDATTEAFAKAYNAYMGSLIGTVTHRPVRTKLGYKEHYTIYLPEWSEANREEYLRVKAELQAKLPAGIHIAAWEKNLSIVECKMAPDQEVADAAQKVRKAELVRKLTEAMKKSEK